MLAPGTFLQQSGTKYKVQSTKYKVLSTKYQVKVPSTKYQVESTEYKVPSTKYQVKVPSTRGYALTPGTLKHQPLSWILILLTSSSCDWVMPLVISKGRKYLSSGNNNVFFQERKNKAKDDNERAVNDRSRLSENKNQPFEEEKLHFEQSQKTNWSTSVM